MRKLIALLVFLAVLLVGTAQGASGFTNGNVETNPSAAFFSHGPAIFSWATDQYHSASHSLKIQSGSGSLSRWMTKTTSISVTPGERLTFSGWVRSSGASAALAMTFWNSGGGFTGHGPQSGSVGNGNWTLLTLTSTAPSSARYVRLEMRQASAGTTWWDDLSLASGVAPAPGPTPTPPPPPPSGTGCYTASDGVREVNVATQFGTNDSAIRAAINTAQSGACRLYFKAGTYTHTGTLTLNGITATGDGPTSVISASSASQSAIILTGTAPKLKNVRLISPSASGRLNNPESNGALLRNASMGVVDHVTVDRMGSVGIGSWNSSGQIFSNTVRNTLADGIHITACSNVEVGFNTVTNPGDDMIGLVSYLKDGCQVRANVHHNTVSNQPWGRGISCVGCRDSRITDNSISNSAGAGILIAREDAPWYTYGVSNVEISRNKVVNPATIINHFANIRGSCGGGSFSITNVFGSGNLLDRAKPGVRFDGVSPCTVSGINIGWTYFN